MATKLVDKATALRRAIDTLKNSQYGVTGIKVELEANLDRDYNDWEDEESCHDWFMARLAEMDLAERGTYGHYDCKGALAYAQFYNDGSVDSEFTFTIKLDNPDNIYLLPKIIQIFKDFADEVGNGMDVNGAGMHMALIRDENYRYPCNSQSWDDARFRNFSRSMNLLLPALYFLASHNDRSRGMSYRQPRIGMDTHRSAIDFRCGVLEYRIFDTCYDNPEDILDNVMVMANTIKYWSRAYINPGVDKITKQIYFGNDSNRRLDRFYRSIAHIDLLNAGLAKLKPACYTIGELKTKRGFKVNRGTFSQAEKRATAQAKNEYDDYVKRQKWAAEVLRFKHVYLATVDNTPATDEEAESVMRKAQASAETEVSKTISNIKKLDAFITERVQQINNTHPGDYSLEVQ